MFAILKTGGKQYSVKKETVFTTETLAGDVGDTISLEEVLCICDSKGKMTLGHPLVKGAAVKVKILEHARHDKILVFKKRRRKNSRRLNGHRQNYTSLQVVDIVSA